MGLLQIDPILDQRLHRYISFLVIGGEGGIWRFLVIRGEGGIWR